MHILLNGERRELAGPRTVRALLDELGIDSRVVAVEVNRAIVRRDRHADTIISEGAEVEIVAFVGGGASRGRRRAARARAGIIAMVCALSTTIPASARQEPQTAPPAPILTEETVLLYNGWALLAAGDVVKAASYAADVLRKYPRSIAAASLLVEAEIARAGGLAGLDAYEAWLGSRKLEDPYLFRRAARAILWAATTKPEVATDALQYLAADDDAEARAQLARRMVAGGLGETRALARIGDPGAVRRLIDQLERGEGSKMVQIEALVQSKSPLAIPALTKLLRDKNYPDHVAAAADGLGALKATAAIPELQRLYNDTSLLASIRYSAATGLFQLGDMTGVTLLQQKLTSEFPYVAIDTARRMASQPDGTWQAVVRKYIDDEDPVVRLKAAELVAPFDRELARQSLERLMADGNPSIRDLAGQVMVQRVAPDFTTLRAYLRSASALTQVTAAGRVLELSR